MTAKTIQIMLLCFIPVLGWSQDYERIVAAYKDSSHFKVVFRTEEDTGIRQVTIDNMTARVYGDTTKLYYMRYGDGLISSMTIPYNIMDDLIELENNIITQACKEDGCEYSVLIELNESSVRIPVDMLYVELISSFMLKHEE